MAPFVELVSRRVKYRAALPGNSMSMSGERKQWSCLANGLPHGFEASLCQEF